MQRVYDKETIIRVHVVIALSRLVGTESPDEIEQGGRTILQTLLDTISTDPAAYVQMLSNVEIRNLFKI
jgi:condensin complex subunit 3